MAAADLASKIRGATVRGLLGLPHPLLRLLAGRPVGIDGQQLDVEVQMVLRLLALAGEEPLERLTPERARVRVRNDAQTFEGPKIEVARVEPITVSGADGPLGGRLYVPPQTAGGLSGSDAASGLLVFFHGGGFVVGDLESHDNVCRFLSRNAGIRVLAVDYRLAPEHRFPAAIDDALAAFRFTLEHAAELGAAADRIAVGGDSAGGNLAAGVARLTAAAGEPAPAFQLLFYPWVDLSRKRRSYQLFGDGFYLTESDLEWDKQHYVASPSDALDPRCSPALADDLAGVTPAYVVTAGFDPLRDEGEEYGARLHAAGARVVVRRHPGLIHGFVNTSQMGHSAREALLEAAGALRFALSSAAPVAIAPAETAR
ncbi:MAG TPA: alpha/beta hydrolase [Solirubrobacteraceae bacterium]|nr:alpha/beta hydrolase [Solirubrobacteraceae bacterium]